MTNSHKNKISDQSYFHAVHPKSKNFQSANPDCFCTKGQFVLEVCCFLLSRTFHKGRLPGWSIHNLVIGIQGIPCKDQHFNTTTTILFDNNLYNNSKRNRKKRGLVITEKRMTRVESDSQLVFLDLELTKDETATITPGSNDNNTSTLPVTIQINLPTAFFLLQIFIQ